MSAPTTSKGASVTLPDRYDGAALVPEMLTPNAIWKMTELYQSPQDTVAVWEGKAYIPSLSRCIKELGRWRVEAMLKFYLIMLNAATNAARPLSEAVIEAMVPVVLRHAVEDLDVTINLADLRIIFDRAMAGQYGKPYGGFTCQEVCQWFDSYNLEKMQAIDMVEQRRKLAESSARTNGRLAEIAAFRKANKKYQLEKMKQQNKQ